MLEKLELNRCLYLAIPDVIYETFFKSDFAQAVIKKQHINLIVYSIEEEVITQWLT